MVTIVVVAANRVVGNDVAAVMIMMSGLLATSIS